MSEEVKTTVRFEPNLYEQVKRAADNEKRSVNMEIQVLIQRGLEASKQMPLFE